MSHYVCLVLACTENTGSQLLLYCKKHSDAIEQEILTGVIKGESVGDAMLREAEAIVRDEVGESK